MKYMLTLFGPEHGMEDASPEEMKAEMDRWGAYSQEAVDKGAFVAGEGLQPSATASTVTIPENGGERSVTDGPFAESKEQLGGFYVLECKDLDEALDWAKKIPLRAGAVEVRPVMVFDESHRGLRSARRPPVPARVGAGGREPDPRSRRLRPRRGGRAGGLRRRPRALALRRHPRQPRRLDHPRRPQQGDRPAPPRADLSGEEGGARGPGGAGAERRGDRDRGGAVRRARRPPAPDLHLLSPGPETAGEGGAHAAHPRRPHHGRDRQRLPHLRGDHGPAAGPRQGQDPRRSHPVRGPVRRAAPRATDLGAGDAVSDLQRGLLRLEPRTP